MGIEEVKRKIKEDKFVVLVVTPAILNNYFLGSEEASVSDFTLLVFDECHHAKEGHPYNTLLYEYYKAAQSPGSTARLPQVRWPSPSCLSLRQAVRYCALPI